MNICCIYCYNVILLSLTKTVHRFVRITIQTVKQVKKDGLIHNSG